MSQQPRKRHFATRPGDPESWIKASGASSTRTSNDGVFSARLTIDVTSDQRARIKIAAFQRGVTVADMLRELLAREFPTVEGDPS